jgi:PIN domain nuclease of toxin-antitoxin system
VKLLLDTHVLFWWFLAPDELSMVARNAIEASDEVYVSAASAWEIAVKVRLGRWEEARGIAETYDEQMAAEEFRELSITAAHARSAGFIVSPHKDPFDRLLAAQALLEGLTLVTTDAKMPALGAPCLW